MLSMQRWVPGYSTLHIFGKLKRLGPSAAIVGKTLATVPNIRSIP